MPLTLADNPEAWENPEGAPVPVCEPGKNFAAFPGRPCKLCSPRAVAANGQPGQQWCKDNNVCAATTDWDAVYGGR